MSDGFNIEVDQNLLGALVAARVLTADSLVRRLSIGWEESGEPFVVTVTACERPSA